MNTGTAVVACIQKHAADGNEVAALDLHVGALASARQGDIESAAALLAAAQRWEASNGYERGSLHTSHQMALTMNFNGDLSRLRKYYDETLGTLRRLRNREGVGLCLRTIGELALVSGFLAETEKAWEVSQRIFQTIGVPETRQLAVWLSVLRAVTEADRE